MYFLALHCNHITVFLELSHKCGVRSHIKACPNIQKNLEHFGTSAVLETIGIMPYIIFNIRVLKQKSIDCYTNNS